MESVERLKPNCWSPGKRRKVPKRTCLPHEINPAAISTVEPTAKSLEYREIMGNVDLQIHENAAMDLGVPVLKVQPT